MSALPVAAEGLLNETLLAVLRDSQTAIGRPAVGAFAGPGLLVALVGFEDERAPLADSALERLGLCAGLPVVSPDRSAADEERAQMAHDCSRALQDKGACTLSLPVAAGGLLTTVAWACAPASGAAVGCALVLPSPRAVGTAQPAGVRAQLFHEAAGRFLVAIPAVRYADAMLLATSHGVPLLPLGRTGGSELVVRASDGGRAFTEVVRVALADLTAVLRSPDSMP